MNRIVIIGAGIFGLCAARTLHERGHAVTLVDAGALPEPGASSTDVSKLIRADYGDDAAYTDLMLEALEGWREWNTRFEETLFHEIGFLLLTHDTIEHGGFEEASRRLLAERGVPTRRMDLERLAALPFADGVFRDGYLSTNAGWADVRLVLRLLLEDVRQRGIDIRERTPFANILEHAGRATGIQTRDGSEIPADVVLVAAGAWTPVLLPHLSEFLFVSGHPVFHLRVPDPEAFRPPRLVPWSADISRTGWYGFTATEDGILKIGHHGRGRRVLPDGNPAVNDEETARMRAFLARALPDLAGAEIAATRLCLYCDTLDGAFWIDHDPDHPGVVVAAGGSGHAFKTAPILGDMIANVVEGRPDDRTERFRWRPEARPGREGARTS